jgi:hypothetical protein
MKLFECQNCRQPLYFENTRCESCGRQLGYLPARDTVTALQAIDGGLDGGWRSEVPAGADRWRPRGGCLFLSRPGNCIFNALSALETAA